MSHADPGCADFGERLHLLARGCLPEPAREWCLLHAAGCVACAGRLDQERALTAALRVLAEADESFEASAAVEPALLAGFRESWSPAARPLFAGYEAPARRLRTAAAALAASLALASIASSPSLRERYGPRPAEAEEVGSNDDPSAFIPLVYGEPLADLDSVQVVRVRLERTALASFGLPASGNPDAPSVDADVLLGHDGVARGIRFVSLSRGEEP